MMNCINCSNADSETIVSDIDLSWRNSNVKLKSLHNDEKYVANIIDFLIQTSTLKKEKSKDHSWKEVAVKLMQHLQNDSEEKTMKIKMHSLQRMYRNWKHLYNCLASSYKHKIAHTSHQESHHEWTW